MPLAPPRRLPEPRPARVTVSDTDLALQTRATQEMLTRALAATGSVAWSIDLRSGVIQRSPNAREVYGLLPGAELGRGFDLVHPADLSRYQGALAEAVKRRGAYSAAFRLIRPIDGRVAWMEEHGRAYEGSDGKTRLVAGIVVDVTERHAAELARAVEHAALRALARPGSVNQMQADALRAVCEELGWDFGVAWRVDQDLDLMREAAHWAARGQSPAALVRATRLAVKRRGEGLAGLAWARGRATVIHDLAALDRVPRAGHAVRGGLRTAYLFPVHGRRRIVGVLEFFSRAVEPVPPRVVEALESVARQLGQALERRQAEDALARQRGEQQLILDTVPAMIWFKDSRNRVLRCNRAAAEWFGKPPADIEGRSAEELFPERAEAYHRDDMEVIASGKPKLGVIEECVSPTGKRCWIRRDTIPYNHGRQRGVIIFALDVTAIQRAKEALRESQRQREFVANVSHEFRTPVAAIKGFAETLRKGALEEPRHRARFVRIIEAQAERLRDLIEDLLTLSALEDGRGLKVEALDLSDLARGYVRDMGAALRARRVRVCLDAGQRVDARGSRAYLRQALENLVSNAVKFSRPGGRIWIQTARLRGGGARLTVRDEGIGIAPEDCAKLFSRFFRVDKTPARGHSGLGLNIVKKIAESHGGKVTVESRLGKGSAFHLTLPG
jgi:PAS domain S-box-containing protein